LGVRRDHVKAQVAGAAAETANATTLRAGAIVEVVKGVSPFFSYTQSFDPISGTASDGNPFKPKRGEQFEAGVKFHPDDNMLVTLTGYHIKETKRPVDDPTTPSPFDQRQAGSLTSKGFEVEARYELPADFQILANYSFVEAEIAGEKHQVENIPKHNASVWATKTVALGDDISARMGGGVRYSSANYSFGPFFPGGVRTPGYALVDALLELTRRNWTLSVNATNLLGKEFYAACLSRGDCFNGAERNVFATLSYKF
jgi:iron complex outermembrane receptor protein